MLRNLIKKSEGGGLKELLKQAGSCKICIRKFLRRLGTVFALTRQAHRLPCQRFAHHSPHFAQQVHRTRLRFVRGFTLAEVLLVLVILGVIAAITMPTLNLSGNKDEALKVKAMKVLGDIDKAFDLIKFNDSSGDLLRIYDPYSPGATISISDPRDKDKLKAVLAKYLKITNKPCEGDSCYCSQSKNERVAFYLNNGACVGITVETISSKWFKFPDSEEYCGEERGVVADAALAVDVNGDDGPNKSGIDRFYVPIKYDGIDYSCRPCHLFSSQCIECAPNDPDRCIRCGHINMVDGVIKVTRNCTLDPSDGQCKDCETVTLE